MARYTAPVVSDPRKAQERQQALEQLEPIPGDTYAVKNELKALGAVWDASRQIWRIAPEKMTMARALVDNQALAIAAAAKQAETAGELSDPFEDEDGPDRLTVLAKKDGDTYAARDALRAIGARWDGDRRAWVIREERAEYARAVLAYVADPPPFPESASEESVDSVGEESASANASSQEETEKVGANPPLTPSANSKASTGATAPPTTPRPARRSESTPRVESAPMAVPSENRQVQRTMAERIKLGGLWLNKGRDGREYLSGRLSPTVKILIFRNDFKTNDSQPSHIMYLAPIEQEESQRPATPAPDSFFGASSGRPGEEFDGGDFGGDFGDAFGDDEPEGPPAPPARSSRPQASSQQQSRSSAPQQRPQPENGNRPAQGRPASTQGQPPRRPVPSRPPAPDNNLRDDEMEDPFAD